MKINLTNFKSNNSFTPVNAATKNPIKITNSDRNSSNELTLLIKNYMTLEEHAPEVLSHLVGNLLGDAYAKHGSLTTSIQIAGSEKHSVYIGYLHEFYSSRGYCSNKPLAKSSHTLLNGKTYLTFRFYTYAFQSFNLLHEMFYRPANEAEKLCGRVFIKIVPKNIVQFLTPQALAVWIMDDGGFYKKKQILTISTDGFVQEDLELLQKALAQNFGLIFKQNKVRIGKLGEQQNALRLTRKQLPILIIVVKPFFVTTMFYKLGLDLNGNSLVKTKFYMDSLLENLDKISPKLFAEWFSQNGCFQKRSGVFLSAPNLTLTQVELLLVILEKNFKLNFKIHKAAINKNGDQQYRLRLSKSQVHLLIPIIKPFMDPSMHYKLGL